MDWSVNKVILIFFCLGLFLPTGSIGQEDSWFDDIESVTPAAENTSPLPETQLDSEAWKELSKDLDFGEKQEIEEPELPERQNINLAPKALGPYILGAVVIVLLIILIRLLTKHLNEKDNKLQEGTERLFTLEEIEEDLPLSELEQFLRMALEKKDYRTAVRVYYLMVIQDLNEAGLIQWERNKTNYQYLSELRNNPNYSAFSNLTLTFEYAWYGEAEVNEQAFLGIEPKFKQFIQLIAASNK